MQNHFNNLCNCFESGDKFAISKHFDLLNHFDDSLEAVTYKSKPSSDWIGADWLTWHKSLVDAFKNGRFKSGIKYPYDKSVELANNVFNVWFEKNASFKVKNFAGYDSQFFAYFKSVGLENILSIFQQVANVGTNVVTNTGEVVTNVSGAARGASESIQTIGKFLPYIILVVALLIAYFYFRKANE